MREFKEIIASYDQANRAGLQCVLATVVRLEGSSYRRPGARMLVTENGKMTGAISGGCLEGDALQKALLTFTEKKSKLVTYDTTDESDEVIGIQLGCEGIIHILFEYIHSQDPSNPIELMRLSQKKRQELVLVTGFDLTDKKNLQLGTSLLLNQEQLLAAKENILPLVKFAQEEAAEVFSKRISQVKDYAHPNYTGNLLLQFIQPAISLHIIGAGNDAIPLINIAHQLGWDVSVVDGRNTHARKERFISACQILVSKPEHVLEKIAIDSRTCFVLMTHNYQYDIKMLAALLHQPISYIGILGPKKKLQKMIAQLTEEGIAITESMLNKIYGPTGLEIGAETPEEIAISILAEIQAVFTNKTGSMLRLKKDLIHS
jgi:xanthine dehydrogenase accessory factor